MTYTHGHHESVLRSHKWRTVDNSAAYLAPHLTTGISVLDLGCGPGTITADIGRRVAPGRVLGIDSSANVIEEARRDAGGGSGRRLAVDGVSGVPVGEHYADRAAADAADDQPGGEHGRSHAARRTVGKGGNRCWGSRCRLRRSVWRLGKGVVLGRVIVRGGILRRRAPRRELRQPFLLVVRQRILHCYPRMILPRANERPMNLI